MSKLLREYIQSLRLRRYAPWPSALKRRREYQMRALRPVRPDSPGKK